MIELRKLLERTRELEALRAHLESQRQLTTQQIKESQIAGNELARRIRLNIKAVHGKTSPLLLGYGVKPRPTPRGEIPHKPLLPPRRRDKKLPKG